MKVVGPRAADLRFRRWCARVIRTAVVEAWPRDRSVDHRHRLRSGRRLVIYRRFDWRRLYPDVGRTRHFSGAILFIIGTDTRRMYCGTLMSVSARTALREPTVSGPRDNSLAVSVR